MFIETPTQNEHFTDVDRVKGHLLSCSVWMFVFHRCWIMNSSCFCQNKCVVYWSRPVFNRGFIPEVSFPSRTLQHSESVQIQTVAVKALLVKYPWRTVASCRYPEESFFIRSVQVGIWPRGPAVWSFISSLLCQWECWRHKLSHASCLVSVAEGVDSAALLL